MGALSEKEIFDCMQDSFARAIDCLLRMSEGERGPLYRRFREAMKLIEGTCRQASAWREDTRWLPLGLKIAEAQPKVAQWLRERPVNPKKFTALAMILQSGREGALAMQHKATGKVGMILPTPKPSDRPRNMSQIILPAGFNRETRH